ncbi:hypothetical protein [Nitratidesulfovibrio liaohensis]|uniref:hypothetical protein n=1 Tax=Nitratidesulfovibrio liaohensis TaxID=2604158 RepID=UPI001FB94698|nr:hypothetical protein [Nitratidesulfovibrio liaohensis]
MRGDNVRRVPCLSISFRNVTTSRLLALLLALAVFAVPTVTEAERGDMPNALSGHGRAAVNGAGDARRVALHSSEPQAQADNDGWIDMPGGSRPAYIGIHGGTVPVSLLATRGGSTMVAMVGETGSDFLYVLRGGRNQSAANGNDQTEAASELLAAAKASDGAHASSVALDASRPNNIPGARTAAMPEPGANGTVLFASTPEGSVPVIYASGRSFESLDIALADWTPFGLTEDHMASDGKGKIVADKKAAKKAKQVARSAKPEQTDKVRIGKAKSGKADGTETGKSDKTPRLPRNEKGPVSIQDASDSLIAA